MFFSLAGVYFRKVGLALFLRYFRGFSAYFCHLAHSTQGQAAGHKRLVHEHTGWHCQGYHRGATGYTLRNVSNSTRRISNQLLYEISFRRQLWLQHKGSPHSRIDKAIFTPNEPIPALNFSSFSIKR